MINRRLSASEAAELLGVKPATLYAYVSRGILPREKGAQGSSFDPRDVARLARSGRARGGEPRAGGPRGEGARGEGARGEGTSARGLGRGGEEQVRWDAGRKGLSHESHATEPLFVTELTLIERDRLYYRGLDSVELSRTRSFEEVAGWLWTSEWPDSDEVWSPPDEAAAAVRTALVAMPRAARPLERFMLAVLLAGLGDDLRHDLTGAAVPVIGRGIISLLAATLGSPGTYADTRHAVESARSIAERMWESLSILEPTDERVAVMNAALVLSADHELAPSTMAARVTASFRADPYAVVSTGLGPASGSWAAGSTGAPSEVEQMLEDCLVMGVERAMGERLRRTGSVPHGFGMPLYPAGDPRGNELLSRLDQVDGPSERHAAVRKVLALAEDRRFPPPNVDLGLGALSFCAGMPPESGQAIATLAKVAGWLAHALEEYDNPSRFRSRAYYVGQRPQQE